MDILNYELTAYDQKASFNTIQTEMERAYDNSGRIPTRRILELFAVLTPNRRDILRRGPLTFTKDQKKVSTVYDEDQMITFGDEALGQVFLSLPGHLSAGVKIDSKKKVFSLELKDRLEMQVDKLAEMGSNRSAFQIIKRLDFNVNYFISVLSDSLSPDRITNLVVYLDQAHLHSVDLSKINYLEEVGYLPESAIQFKTRSMVALDNDNCCDIFDSRWVVYKKKGDQPDENGKTVCFVQQTNCGGPDAQSWEVLVYKDTQQEAEDWKRTSGRCY